VLVVDDVDGNVRLVASVLEPHGYVVSSVSDGESALGEIHRTQPDLILLDVMMPGLDGFEACRQLKADPETRLIPVVLVTALRDRHNRIHGLEAGADDFITKPFNAPGLRARVQPPSRLNPYPDDPKPADRTTL